MDSAQREEVDVWANTPAAHFLWEYVDVNGLKFPRHRSAFLRRPDGRPDLDDLGCSTIVPLLKRKFTNEDLYCRGNRSDRSSTDCGTACQRTQLPQALAELG